MTKLCWLAICLLPALIVGQGYGGGERNWNPPKDLPRLMPDGYEQEQQRRQQHPKDIDTRKNDRRSNDGYGGFAPTTIAPSDFPAPNYGGDLPAETYGGTGSKADNLPVAADTYGGGRPVEQVDFDCLDLADGNYADPKDRCNNFYYVCSGYRASKIDCPNKDLYFDPDNNVCEEKHHVPACGGEIRTTVPVPRDDTLDTYSSMFDCSDQENGYYVNPADKCSAVYYSCSGGRSKQHQCQVDLDLVFDPDTLACELKDTTYVCTGTRSTRAATYGSLATTPSYPLDCKGKEDGLYADPTEKCSHTFYVCSGGSTSLSTCAGSTFFDAKSQSCDIWMNVFDCSGMEPSKDEPLSTYQHKEVDFDCSSLKPGSYPDPKSKCSNHYYVCTNGIAYEMSCPSTLFWDPDALLCTHFDDIFACTGTTKGLTTPTTAYPFVPSDARIPEFDCSDKEDGFFVDPTNKCSTFYFVCSHKHDYKLHCPDGLYFDLESSLCEIWNHVFDCSGKRVDITYPTMQPTFVTDSVPIDCKTLPDGDYADTESKCSSVYYSCSGGRGSKRMCAGGATYFDPELSLCEIFDNVPACSGHDRPVTTTLPPRDVETFPFDCTRMHNGLYPAGDCETHHWSCIGGVTHKTECPFGLKYDIEMNKCDLKTNIPKCGGQRPTPALTPYETTEPSYPVDCHQLTDGTYSDPSNPCDSAYYVCNSGRTTKMDCPPYLFFDIEHHRCDIKKRIVACGGDGASSDDQSSYQQKPRGGASSYDQSQYQQMPVRGASSDDQSYQEQSGVGADDQSSYQQKSGGDAVSGDQSSYQRKPQMSSVKKDIPQQPASADQKIDDQSYQEQSGVGADDQSYQQKSGGAAISDDQSSYQRQPQMSSSVKDIPQQPASAYQKIDNEVPRRDVPFSSGYQQNVEDDTPAQDSYQQRDNDDIPAAAYQQPFQQRDDFPADNYQQPSGGY